MKEEGHKQGRTLDRWKGNQTKLVRKKKIEG